MGGREGYKNAAILTKAFAESEPCRHEHQLLFAGGGALRNKELADIARLGITDYVQQLNVNDAEPWHLYRNASAVVVPSMAEGFSLPLVEGLSADVPVVCSDIPVHREVAGRFSTDVNPMQHSDWSDIQSLISSIQCPSEILGELAFRKQCNYFSKERMVEEHIKAYSDLLA